MNAWMLGGLDGLCSTLDIHLGGSRETTNDGAFDLFRDRLDRFKIAIARDRKTRLDHIDAELLELSRKRQLLLKVHAAARGLLAITQSRIEDSDLRLAHRPVSPPRGSPACICSDSFVTLGPEGSPPGSLPGGPGSSTGKSSRPVRARQI